MCVHVHVHVHCDLLVQFVLHVTHHLTLRRSCHAIELHRRSKRNLGFARSVKHLVKPHRILLMRIESPSVSLAKPGELFRKADAEGKYSLAKPGRPYWLCRWISMTARHMQYRPHAFFKKAKEQARQPIQKYRDAAMHAAGDLGCENISLAKPGDINMCTSIRTSWQKDSQQLSGTPSALASPEL